MLPWQTKSILTNKKLLHELPVCGLFWPFLRHSPKAHNSSWTVRKGQGRAVLFIRESPEFWEF